MTNDVCEMTLDEMMEEIERLQKSDYVKLARKKQNQMLRQKVYALRSLERKGKKIAEEIRTVGK